MKIAHSCNPCEPHGAHDIYDGYTLVSLEQTADSFGPEEFTGIFFLDLFYLRNK